MTAVSHPSPLPTGVQAAPGALAGGLRLAAAFAMASLAWLGANAPACAQFMSNYPVIVVPPPPAQNLFVPKPQPIAPKPTPAPAPGQTQQTEGYHGQTREPVGRF